MAKAAAPYTNEFGDRINLLYIYIHHTHDVLPEVEEGSEGMKDIYLYLYISNPNATCLSIWHFRFHAETH